MVSDDDIRESHLWVGCNYSYLICFSFDVIRGFIRMESNNVVCHM